jgi:hypothetical protein
MLRSKWPLLAALATLIALTVLALAAGPILRSIAATRLRSAAAARGLDAGWSRLAVQFPRSAAITDLSLVRRADGDTLLAVDSLEVSLRLAPLFRLQIRPARVMLAHARARSGGRAAVDEDTLALEEVPEEPPASRAPEPAAERVRTAADALVRMLLVPARDLPALDLRDVTLAAGATAGGEARALHFDVLSLTHAGRGRGASTRLEAAGRIALQRTVPFTFDLTYDARDRLTGHARFGIPDPAEGTTAPLAIELDGIVTQNRRAGTVTIGEQTVVRVGRIPIRVAGEIRARGPRVRLDLAADSLTAPRFRSSVPRPVLGPLLELDISGAWDQRLAFDLDLEAPDSVRFEADVIPHDMRLEGSGALAIGVLHGPFTARIHLPRRTTERALAPYNPFFRTLDRIDSTLVRAVVTNEDGAFYRHGGFNMDAVRQSIAENARAGRFRRGAGTITMQLARNLFLGHERTLSRKSQEVALAWILEHLTSLPKERLLEIYLNIIEWGPGVHGADEATRFYFGHDASRVTPAEALFLATVVPAPSKWKWRFEKDGTLRHGTRAQMHFIGRRMIDKGWLAREALPPADSLRVELLGLARDLLMPAGEDPRFEVASVESVGVGTSEGQP